MTKILIVNQPLNNRGDEAAHKALIRALLKNVANAEIRILFVDCYSPDGMRQFAIKSPNVKYININSFWWHQQIGPDALKNGRYFLWHFHPTTHDIKKQYKWADYVICAPGGICMGGFQNWNHLYYLQWAKHCKKALIYFGRSIGPFPTATEDNKLFKKKSIELLKYCSYISLRDSESELFFHEILPNSSYHSTVDTAFLDSPNASLPYELKRLIDGKKYIVFVPNMLLWHNNYRGKGTKEQLITFYTQIAKNILEKFGDIYILMLPQTFDNFSEEENDIYFFREIAERLNNDRVMITADSYSSDIQQSLIKKAQMVIGARYHSIVFAINQNIPFIALCYEHKMWGLLKKLNQEEHGVDINDIFEQTSTLLNNIKTKLNGLYTKQPNLKNHANEVALTEMKIMLKALST